MAASPNSLLPPNATLAERALEAATARLGDVPSPLRALWSADACPVSLLPWLAWSLSIDTWDAAWPEAVKRERIRQAINIQRHKGTAKSVRDVVASFGGQVAVREWFQQDPPGEPYTFDVLVSLNGQDGEPATARYVEQVITEIALTKPARAHFTFTQALAASQRLAARGAARACIYARLQFSAATGLASA